MNNGKFVMSLDFELMWGVRDKKDVSLYKKNILAVHQVIPRLLIFFREYDVKATFSTVGFLFFETSKHLLESLPITVPQYSNPNLSPYNGYFDNLGKDYDLYHFAPELINKIKEYPENEIGTHTFSHFYCLESGQTIENFKDDISAAILIAKQRNIQLTSLVFPRNQFNEDYLKVCNDFGIFCYRGNEHSWLYRAKQSKNENRLRRALRLLDAYINLTGHNCYHDNFIKSNTPINIPSSRFLRPFSKKISFLEKLKLYRIKSGMSYAAKNNLTYHLWWHPHNFGINQDENFNFLKNVLLHYKYLNTKYNFQCYTMSNLAEIIKNER